MVRAPVHQGATVILRYFSDTYSTLTLFCRTLLTSLYD